MCANRQRPTLGRGEEEVLVTQTPCLCLALALTLKSNTEVHRASRAADLS